MQTRSSLFLLRHVNVNYAFVFCINSEFLPEIQFTLQNENKCSSLHRCGMEVLAHYFLEINSRFLLWKNNPFANDNCYKSRNYNPTNQKISKKFFSVQPELFNKFIYSETRDLILQGIASCSLPPYKQFSLLDGRVDRRL